MSIESNASKVDRSFEEIIDAIKDPAIERFYQQIQQDTSMMVELGANGQDKSDFLNSFDAKWPHFGKYLGISGVIHVPVEGEDMTVPRSCDDLLVVSNGFCYVNDSVYTDDGDMVAENFQVAHHIGLLDQEGSVVAYGYAKFHEVVIDYPEDSTELSENRLRVLYPELMEDLDIAILNSDSPEDAALNINGLNMVGDPGDEDYCLSVIDMKNYIDSLIDFEKDMLYTMRSEGSIVAMLEGSMVRSPDFTQIDSYIRAHGIRFVQSVVQPDSELEKLTPHLWCTIYGEDRDDDIVTWIPIEHVLHLRNVRKGGDDLTAEDSVGE